MIRRLVLGICLLLLTGCIDGTVRVTILPDGAGSIALDLGYEEKKWPDMFGDPFIGFLTQGQLKRLTDPGLIAWSEPEVTASGGARRWSSEVFFDDIGQVQFLGRHEGKTIEAMGFAKDLPRGEVAIRPGFLVYLEDPLPLPAPKRVGMSGVSLSPALLDAIRKRIRPVIEGLDVDLEIVLPSDVRRADGLDEFQGRVARLHVDADRLAAAFNARAGVLTDVDALRGEKPMWAWTVPATWDQTEAEELRRRRAEAMRWWSASGR